jgi:hypothetical protein
VAKDRNIRLRSDCFSDRSMLEQAGLATASPLAPEAGARGAKPGTFSRILNEERDEKRGSRAEGPTVATLVVLSDLAGPASVRRGGLAMYELQWLRGLERLGHRVLCLEFLRQEPGGAAVRYFRETMVQWWHAGQCALLVEDGLKSLYGLDARQVARWAACADAVLTLAARYRRDPYPLVDRIRPRILIEQDPGYTHLWAAQGDPAEVIGEHDHYCTVGGHVGSPGCSLPTLGKCWRHAWNPVVLEWWSGGPGPSRPHFTTVADWRGYGYLEFEGQVLGPKAEEFRKFIDLPRRAREPLELALTIDPDDPDAASLQGHGWRLQDPEVVASPDQYRDYVAGSPGEFSCAKGGYVGTHCGWFSDRSACYLAAGRPVVLQATGFEDLLPTGQGLFAVRTVEEAAEAIRTVRRDYARHSVAAREIARACFDSDAVLGRLLAEVGVPRPQRLGVE